MWGTEMEKQMFDALAYHLNSKKEQYVSSRSGLEQQWLRNLRQYRGVYDPDVLERIPADKSRAYPRDTRKKVKGFVAKMIEMMFPAQERNWTLVVTPYPSLPKEAIQQLILQKTQERLAEAEHTGEVPPPPSSDEIEQLVLEEAKKRMERMKKTIDDQIMDSTVDWVSICKKVVRSGGIYGAGIVRCPMVRKQTERTWEFDPETQEYIAIEKQEARPFPEFVKIWDGYPDLSASTWDEQEGFFERMVFSKSSLIELEKRPKFKKEVIRNFLKDNKKGNYTAPSYEADLRRLNSGDSGTGKELESRYEVFRWYGYFDEEPLIAAEILEERKANGSPRLIDAWLLGDQIIFADLAPFGNKVSDVYHAYIYAEDEESGLMGLGIPEELRDRQMSICATTRALYDNIAASAGPIYEVATDLLKRNTSVNSIRAFTTFEREGDGPDLQYPAIRSVQTAPIIPMVSNVIKNEREMLDQESDLPSWTLGNAQPLGEAFRTSSNMSQMTGGANMITKDHVRAFDRFTSSVINSFLQWNMEFNDDELIKGDYQVKPRGAISLVAKEVRGAALDQFITTLDPEDRALLRRLDTLVERLKARDLPTELAVSPEEAEQIMAQRAQEQQRAQEIEQSLVEARTQKFMTDAEKSSVLTERTRQMFHVEVTEAMARVQKLLSEAKSQQDKTQLATLDKMLQGLLAQAGGADE